MPSKRYFVVAFHPETLTNVSLVDQVNEILSALNAIVKEYEIVLIGSNADTNSGIIQDTWKKYSQHNEHVTYIENLNVDSYLYLVKNAVALIGNSSSGIIEAPSLETITINIGDRQAGRVSGKSVLNISCDRCQIEKAIKMAIENVNKAYDNPYYLQNTSELYYEKTLCILKNIKGTPKEFYDMTR